MSYWDLFYQRKRDKAPVLFRLISKLRTSFQFKLSSLNDIKSCLLLRLDTQVRNNIRDKELCTKLDSQNYFITWPRMLVWTYYPISVFSIHSRKVLISFKLLRGGTFVSSKCICFLLQLVPGGEGPEA